MRRLCQGVAGLLLAVVCSGGPAHADTVMDNFNDNLIDVSFWGGWIEGSGVTLAETNQRVEVSFAPDAFSDIFGAGYDGLPEVQGDFDLQLDYHLLNWPFSNGVRVGLGVVSPGEVYAVERASLGTADIPGAPREAYLVDAAGAILGITPTNDQSGRLRLARTGAQITGYYLGASDWVPVATFGATSEDMAFTFHAWSHDYVFGDQAVSVGFDNFDASGVIPEPAALALLALGGLAVVRRRRK